MVHYIFMMVFAAAMHQSSNKRLLLIYADKSTNPQLTEQLALLNADRAGLLERNVTVETIMLDENQKSFKNRHVKGPFNVILIGKDGGEKLRTQHILTLSKLYSTIDAMPMRQDEMRRH